MDPASVALIERAKRAIADHPHDPRTPALVDDARQVLHHAQPWQDVDPIRTYAQGDQ